MYREDYTNGIQLVVNRQEMKFQFVRPCTGHPAINVSLPFEQTFNVWNIGPCQILAMEPDASVLQTARP